MGRRRIKKGPPKKRETQADGVLERHGKILAAACVVVAIAVGLGLAPLFSPERESPETLMAGRVLYVQHCASCHGARLEGQPDWKTPLPDGRFPAPPHDASGHTWHHDDDFLFRVTRDGGIPRLPDLPSNMPGFGETLRDDEIRAVLAFIKSSWPPGIRAQQAQRNR